MSYNLHFGMKNVFYRTVTFIHFIKPLHVVKPDAVQNGVFLLNLIRWIIFNLVFVPGH